MAAAPNCGSAFRARSWIGSCGLQKSAIVSDSSRPCRTDANTCWSRIRVKNERNPASMTAAGQSPFFTNVACSRRFESARLRMSTRLNKLMSA